MVKDPTKKSEEDSCDEEATKIDVAVRQAINNYYSSGQHLDKVAALRIAQAHGYTFEKIMALADLISADGVAGVGMPRAVGKTHNISRVAESCEQLNKELADKQAELKKESDDAAEKSKTKDTALPLT